MTLQKMLKSRVFWILKKKRKSVFSNYVSDTYAIIIAIHSGQVSTLTWNSTVVGFQGKTYT